MVSHPVISPASSLDIAPIVNSPSEPVSLVEDPPVEQVPPVADPLTETNTAEQPIALRKSYRACKDRPLYTHSYKGLSIRRLGLSRLLPKDIRAPHSPTAESAGAFPRQPQAPNPGPEPSTGPRRLIRRASPSLATPQGRGLGLERIDGEEEEEEQGR
ncbi:hypothetical protein NL676_021087 [Syzygium grande]|nr:hypothetical protein NL676_021087 [Syzygium grande]